MSERRTHGTDFNLACSLSAVGDNPAMHAHGSGNYDPRTETARTEGMGTEMYRNPKAA
jgi:hypothetical protein